jgi:ribosome-interacting GTPase 1
VYCHAADTPVHELETVRAEVTAAGIELPAIVAATKIDEAEPFAHPELEVVPVSVLDDASLDRLRDAVWSLTGLIRVYLHDGGDPVALHPPATVLDVARSIHQNLASTAVGARVWGPSSRFAGQRVGMAHEVVDGDSIEVLLR